MSSNITSYAVRIDLQTSINRGLLGVLSGLQTLCRSNFGPTGLIWWCPPQKDKCPPACPSIQTPLVSPLIKT